MFGIRTGFTQEQVVVLNEYYLLSRYPSQEVKKQLSEKFSVSVQQIDKWFIDKRYKEKTGIKLH